MPVTVEHLTKIYNGSVLALNDLTLDIKTGVTGFLGPNGSGKSTFLKILLGIIDRNSGNVSVLGIDPAQEPLRLRQQIGYVPENDCLPLNLNAVQICHHFGQIIGMPREAAIQRAHECLNYVGIDDSRYRAAGTYSTGMKQRLKLAQALVHDPQLLFVDEPTNGLDPKGREDMILTLQELKLSGKDMIISSHILPDVQVLSDQVAVISNGTLRLHGDISTLLDDNDQVLEIGTNNPQELASLLQNEFEVKLTADNLLRISNATGETKQIILERIADSNLELRRLRMLRRTLDELFLETFSDEKEALS